MKQFTLLSFSTWKKNLLLTSVLLGLLSFTSLKAQITYDSVTFTTVDSTTNPKDDTISWKRKFKVKNPSANGGFIVQKVSYSVTVYKCPKNNGNTPIFSSPTVTYWEVWPVKPNTDSTEIQGPDGHNDNLEIAADQFDAFYGFNTYGSQTWEVELGFVSNPTPGTPRDPGGAGGPDSNTDPAGGSTWDSTSVPEAGTLYATETEPSFWAGLKASGKTSKTTWTAKWNHCAPVVVVRPPKYVESPRPNTDKSGGDAKRTDLTIYPNPTSNTINISAKQNIDDRLVIQIISLTGQVVFETNKYMTHRLSLDVSSLSKGSYIIHISNEENTFNDYQSIIKQ